MRVLLDSDMHGLNYDFVEQLLQVFVANFSNIYGCKTISYNVHSLLYIVDDAQRLGPLSSISCFPFENYLGNLKKLIRKPQNPVAQIRAGELA